MTKRLLALTLCATSGLIAQDNSDQSSMRNQKEPNDYAARSSCCNRCCSKPCCCCVPEPKKCINCECYTPQYYDLQCDWGAFITVDFLYWYARETDLSYAMKFEGKEQLAGDESLFMSPQSYKSIDTSWDPGFRIGLGWNTDCDGWDAYLHWTYYRNKETDSISVPEFSLGQFGFLPEINQTALLNPWVNQSFGSTESAFPFDHIKGRWKFYLNSIDLEFGRKYWLSKSFTLRPYAGLRGAWIKTKFNTKSSRDASFQDGSITYTFRDKFTNRNWGVGLLGGLQPNWYFCKNFILFGNVETSLIWGEFQAKKSENYREDLMSGGQSAPTIRYKNISLHDFFQMTGILDLGIGLRWEEHWCCDRYSTALDFGWEHHIWFDQNHRIKYTAPFFTNLQNDFRGFSSYEEATGNLGYGGFVLHGRLDF